MDLLYNSDLLDPLNLPDLPDLLDLLGLVSQKIPIKHFDKISKPDLASKDEFKLKFPRLAELNQAKLKRFQAESSRAGTFQFSETELTICI